jgi:hypothetical protein
VKTVEYGTDTWSILEYQHQNLLSVMRKCQLLEYHLQKLLNIRGDKRIIIRIASDLKEMFVAAFAR